jgi:hypothetical protein
MADAGREALAHLLVKAKHASAALRRKTDARFDAGNSLNHRSRSDLRSHNVYLGSKVKVAAHSSLIPTEKSI